MAMATERPSAGVNPKGRVNHRALTVFTHRIEITAVDEEQRQGI
jgi:hypothetical protein